MGYFWTTESRHVGDPRVKACRGTSKSRQVGEPRVKACRGKVLKHFYHYPQSTGVIEGQFPRYPIVRCEFIRIIMVVIIVVIMVISYDISSSSTVLDTHSIKSYLSVPRHAHTLN